MIGTRLPLTLAIALAAGCSKTKSASPPQADDAGPRATSAAQPAEPPPEGPRDASGDPLPPSAIARLGSLRMLDRGIASAVFAGGKEIVSSGTRGYVVWDAATGARLAELKQDDPGHALAVSPGGALLATAVSGRGKVQLWDLPGRRPLGELSPGREVDALCFLDDATLVAGADGLVVAWRIAESAELTRLAVESADLTGLACAPGMAAWGDATGGVYATGLDGKAAPARVAGASGRVVALAVSPDGKQIAAGTDAGNIEIWPRAGGKPVAIQAHDRTVGSVAWLDGAIWSAGGDAWLRAWKPDGTLLREIPTIKGLSVQFLAVAAGSARGVTWALHRGAKGSEAGRLWLWDLVKGDAAAEPDRHDGPLTSIAFSPDGARLATGSEDATVRLWQTKSGRPLAALTSHQGPVNVVAFDRGGEVVFSAGADAYLHAWRFADDRDDRLLGPIGGEVNALAFTADGQRVVTGDEVGRVWSWDRAARAKLSAHDRRVYASITSVAVAPNSETLAIAGSERAILIERLDTGAELARLSPDAVSTFAVAFSPDGKLLASAGDDGAVRLWDTRTWRPARTLEGHDGTVRSLAFSRDGAKLASGGNDATLRVWDVATGGALATFEGHGGAVMGVALSPDGKLAASASQDRTGLVWKLP